MTRWDILHREKVDGFCLVSSDSDFPRLATRLRESGMLVIGQKKTPNPFIVACDKFIYIEIIGIKDDARPIVKTALTTVSQQTSEIDLIDNKFIRLLRNSIEDFGR